MEVSELSALRQVPPPGPFTLDDLKLEEPSNYVNFRFGFAIIDWIRVKDLYAFKVCRLQHDPTLVRIERVKGLSHSGHEPETEVVSDAACREVVAAYEDGCRDPGTLAKALQDTIQGFYGKYTRAPTRRDEAENAISGRPDLASDLLVPGQELLCVTLLALLLGGKKGTVYPVAFGLAANDEAATLQAWLEGGVLGRLAKTDGAGPSHTELIRRLKEIVQLAPRIDEMVEALDTYVSEVFGAGHSDEFERPPNTAQAAAVLRAIKAAEDIPESHVHAPERGEHHWTVDSPQPNAKPCRVDPTDALGCTCLHAGRGNICKHIIKVLKIKEAGLTDELIVSHLGDAWGSPDGTVEAMLRAMRQANKARVPAPRPGAALTAAAVELPARAPAPQPQQEEKEEEVPEEASISEPEPHPMNPPEYDEL
ncbi:hypothetical protein QBZ16_003281 [Prototheca wickerhamii]|uniref:SWIM-type domain-containing protein n=1 Tax=Prototheca wickerhamii TaxID=3111 RepID=A0AAD9IH89_PROWI|nr:hypothetical protein QBZ16_003281 [Prototheca wickerhamii]